MLQLLKRAGDPGATADIGKLYTKNVAGITQLFFEASDGTVTQVTPAQAAGSIRTLQAGVDGSSATSPSTVGAGRFDPSIFQTSVNGLARSIVFRSVLAATAGMTAEVKLYNETDGSPVAASVLTTASTSPAAVSVVLAVPADLPNSAKVYLVQLRISAGVPGPSDQATLYSATIEVEYS